MPQLIRTRPRRHFFIYCNSAQDIRRVLSQLPGRYKRKQYVWQRNEVIVRPYLRNDVFPPLCGALLG